MAEQGGNKDRKKAAKALLMRLVIPPLLGVASGLISGRLPFPEATKVLIINLTGVVVLLCWLGWYGYERRKIRKKIKENEAEMARIKAEMDELEVKIAQNSKFIALLEKIRHPFGFDKYRWN